MPAQYELEINFKDIELHHWMSEMNNEIRRDAAQNNKMRTNRKFRTYNKQMWGLPSSGHQYPSRNNFWTKLRLCNHKLAIETGRYLRPYKKPEERIWRIYKLEMEDEYYVLTLCRLTKKNEKFYSLTWKMSI